VPMLDFWFDFASTYSYLTALRIDAVAVSRGTRIRWRPFLLGPIFNAQGWRTSPFNLYPAKGRYMVRDIERITQSRGIAFAMPATFPANSLHAARLALAIGDDRLRAAFSRAVFHAQFATGADIGSSAVLAELVRGVGLDDAAIGASATTDAGKLALRRETEVAMSLGIFGAPTFITPDGELFWGDDRLEMAMDWATSRASKASSAQ
jgi:2-hydroxychromene-2-carboxylate isomerase